MAEPNTNRCEQDWERRRRAARDSGVTQDLGNNMTRTIEFNVGFDHTPFPEDCGGGGHGRHGMKFTFRLSGPRGSVVWACTMMNMWPGNVDIINSVNGTEPISVIPRTGRVGDAMSMGVSYHTPVPQYEGQGEFGTQECEYVPGYTECYSDWSSLAGGEILVQFLEHGPHAVWAALARRYSELKDPNEVSEPTSVVEAKPFA